MNIDDMLAALSQIRHRAKMLNPTLGVPLSLYLAQLDKLEAMLLKCKAEGVEQL